MKSTVTVELENAIPLGERPPEYMRSTIGREGTTNEVLAQFHLPNGAEVQDVLVNGRSVGGLQFKEKGRPSVVAAVKLTPREKVPVEVRFTELASDSHAEVVVQPLATAQPVQLRDVPCTRSG